jgi:hypothetical protein
MRRWWVFNFAVVGDDDGVTPYQLNFLGIACGPLLGLLVAAMAYVVAGRHPENGGLLGIAGFLLTTPVGIFNSLLGDYFWGDRVKHWTHRLATFGMCVVLGIGTVVVVAMQGQSPLHQFTPWMIMGLILGLILGAATIQDEYPRSGRRRRREEEEEEEDDGLPRSPRSRPGPRRRRREDE